MWQTSCNTGMYFRMEFVDEKLDACEQNQGDTPITSQPTSFSAVTELNKLLHIQGVRLYTDIWSNYKDVIIAYPYIRFQFNSSRVPRWHQVKIWE